MKVGVSVESPVRGGGLAFCPEMGFVHQCEKGVEALAIYQMKEKAFLQCKNLLVIYCELKVLQRKLLTQYEQYNL